MNYKDNFDEFGNLRENHSPWTLPDLIIVALLVFIVAALVKGWI